jgi:hypothetical protein
VALEQLRSVAACPPYCSAPKDRVDALSPNDESAILRALQGVEWAEVYDFAAAMQASGVPISFRERRSMADRSKRGPRY